MDPGLHVKQAINHLTKVINYAPYVEEDGAALVALTPEDWQVVADAMFYMDTPAEVFPTTSRRIASRTTSGRSCSTSKMVLPSRSSARSPAHA